MEQLKSLSTSWSLPVAAIVAAIGIFATMGLFSTKNHMPVEGRVCSPKPNRNLSQPQSNANPAFSTSRPSS